LRSSSHPSTKIEALHSPAVNSKMEEQRDGTDEREGMNNKVMKEEERRKKKEKRRKKKEERKRKRKRKRRIDKLR
jgi:hypothetical protein